MQTMQTPWIKLKSKIDAEDYSAIEQLGRLCADHDHISLKLELAYKLEDAANTAADTGLQNINEFMAFDGGQLIGYIGICGFGGASMPLEMTGMVHPDYRRRGVFSRLHALVTDECRRRKACGALGLCDKSSASGQGFLKKISAQYQCTEFEMTLDQALFTESGAQPNGIVLRKATNADAPEMNRQNRIYFPDEAADGSEEQPFEGGLLPEDEEKRGMTIYLARKDEQIVGKVNLELINGSGAIYGLGVLPEFRGKGYGRAVLRHAIRKLRDQDAGEIRLQVSSRNDKALACMNPAGSAKPR